jgi:cobalt-zinc-cadmium efflux system protein
MSQLKEHSHHHHSHGHTHQYHGDDLKGKKLLWVTLLNFSITIVQVIGGVLSNSLSLLSDALHNLADSSAILIAFLAGKRSKKQPDKYKTYGYKRIEILAAFFNGIVLIAICLFLFVEAYERFVDPKPIKGLIMLIVASFGLLANLISVLVLHKSKNKNLNIKAAYLHLMGDTLSSVAVIIGGVAIWLFNIVWIDPLITILVGMYIIWHTWSVVKESIDILMQAVPANIDINEIKYNVEKLPEIDNIH